jgi:integrase
MPQRKPSQWESGYPSYLPAFIISLHTGLRASEQWNLRWSDIDLEGKSLTVRKQKTGKGERHVRLNSTAVAAFRSIRKGADLASVPFLKLKRDTNDHPQRLV